MKELTDLPNIGKTLAEELINVGIDNQEKLANIGSAKALFMIKGASGKGCFNMLYALEGAIQNIRWHGLTKEAKEKVKNELNEAIETAKFL